MKEESIPIFLSDITTFFRKRRARLFWQVALGAFSGIFLSLFQPVSYQASSIFQEATEEKWGAVPFQDLLLPLKGESPDLSVLIQSRRLLLPLVRRFGLQALETRSPFFRPLDFFHERKKLRFGPIFYEGRAPLELRISFVSSDQVMINGQLGLIGSPIRVGEAEITICEALVPHQTVDYILVAEEEALGTLMRALSIKKSKEGGGFFYLSYESPDPHLAAQLLNQLMGDYQNYLKQEHDQVASTQLAYLKKRQEELLSELEKNLEQHADYLLENLKERGAALLEEELDILLRPHRELLQRSIAIDLELRKLPSVEIPPLIAELQTERSLLDSPSYTVSLEWTGEKSLETPDLSTSRALLLQAEKELEAIQSRRLTITRLLAYGEMEIGNLGGLLLDPISQQIVSRASSLQLTLQDEKNYSNKERDRISEELSLQQKTLREHLLQQQQIDQIHEEFLKGKIGQIKMQSVRAIDQKIGALKHGIEEKRQEKKKELAEEKEAIEIEMEHIRSSLLSLPERWRREKQIALKTDLALKMIGSLTELVENETLSHRLHQVSSKPVDLAIPAKQPKPLNVPLWAFAGALIPFFFSGIGALLLAAGRGFPVTGEKLLALQFPYLGPVSSDAILRMRQFAAKKRRVALLIGEGEDFTEPLLSLFPPTTPLIQASDPAWADQVAQKRREHPLLFIRSRAPLDSAAIDSLFDLADGIIVGCYEESLDLLTALAKRAYDDGDHRIIFTWTAK